MVTVLQENCVDFCVCYKFIVVYVCCMIQARSQSEEERKRHAEVVKKGETRVYSLHQNCWTKLFRGGYGRVGDS